MGSGLFLTGLFVAVSSMRISYHDYQVRFLQYHSEYNLRSGRAYGWFLL